MNKHLLRLSLGYFALSMLWLLFSDPLLHWLLQDDDSAYLWQLGKGTLFILLTSCMLYVLERRHLGAWPQSRRRCA